MTQVNPFGVRAADESDAQALKDFLMPLYAENALQRVSEPKIDALIVRGVLRQNAIVGIIEGEDGIQASIGLMLEELDYTDDQHVAIKWHFVAPRHRKENYGHRLMQFAAWTYEGLQAMADEPIPLIGHILTSEDLLPKIRLFQRSLPQVGAYFALGCLPSNPFDQIRLDDGRGTHGRKVVTPPTRARSPLLAPAA